jgi:hypothetical protein
MSGWYNDSSFNLETGLWLDQRFFGSKACFFITDTSRISISVHYTGYIWYKNNPYGRFAYWTLKPINVFMQSMIGASIDTFLLQRHFVLDYLVEQAAGL